MKSIDQILSEAKEHDGHHAVVPKAKGGKYTEENISHKMTASEHRDHHGNTPNRTPELEALKSMVEQRGRYIKTQVGLQNKLVAFKRHMDDMPEDEMDSYLETISYYSDKVDGMDKRIKDYIKDLEMPIITRLRKIKGIGDLYIAVLITFLNPYEAPHISSFWAFVGYHGDSTQRYVKGQKGGGHKGLRTELFKIASNFLRNKNEHYTRIFYEERERLENCDNPCKDRMKGGAIKMTTWKETSPNHRRFAATRKMMKIFLAHLWLVWREIEGLPISEPYAQAKLGHNHIMKPEDFGW